MAPRQTARKAIGGLRSWNDVVFIVDLRLRIAPDERSTVYPTPSTAS
jgi:hypothetical protein